MDEGSEILHHRGCGGNSWSRQCSGASIDPFPDPLSWSTPGPSRGIHRTRVSRGETRFNTGRGGFRSDSGKFQPRFKTGSTTTPGQALPSD